MRSLRSTFRFRTLTLGALFWLAAAACGNGSSNHSPTAPVVPPPSATALWAGLWNLDDAVPAGDCMADALRAWHPGANFRLAFDREAGSTHLLFDFGPYNHESDGFWPLEFAGTIAADGTVVAVVPAARFGSARSNPWFDELCYAGWTMQGGELSATLSADGQKLTGTVVESFRANTAQQATFTVRSHFLAWVL